MYQRNSLRTCTAHIQAFRNFKCITPELVLSCIVVSFAFLNLGVSCSYLCCSANSSRTTELLTGEEGMLPPSTSIMLGVRVTFLRKVQYLCDTTSLLLHASSSLSDGKFLWSAPKHGRRESLPRTGSSCRQMSQVRERSHSAACSKSLMRMKTSFGMAEPHSLQNKALLSLI